MRYLFLVRPYRLEIAIIKDFHVACVSGDHQAYLFDIPMDKLQLLGSLLGISYLGIGRLNV